jgi:hypothetical protein
MTLALAIGIIVAILLLAGLFALALGRAAKGDDE